MAFSDSFLSFSDVAAAREAVPRGHSDSGSRLRNSFGVVPFQRR